MSASILVVDDEENARLAISSYFVPKGYEVLGVATLAEARNVIKQGKPDVILLDVQLPDGYGPNLLLEMAHLAFRPPIILMTAYGDIDMAVDAMKNGALDFVQKPIKLVEVEKSIQRAIEMVSMRRELAHLRSNQLKEGDFIVGSTDAMRLVVSQAHRAAAACVSVLITGETGTGKEVLAQYILKNGPRSGKPFIPINCAAIQSTVLESELFGHEPGAYTSADKRKPGLLEVADGGILFLDEIAAMPLDIQAKLLRAIEYHEFRRVGGNLLLKVDVQIVAASNRSLVSLMTTGQFREDLYYRLKVVDLHLPPLRERKQDIPELVGLFIRKNNAHMGINIADMTPRAMQALINYDWPGNIRQLMHTIERAALFCDEPTIDLEHLPPEMVHPQ